MTDKAILKAVLDVTLKQMCSSIKDADLTKDFEVYSSKEFIIDYTDDAVDALDVLTAIKGDEWLLSKIAKAAISAIEQKVELESKIDTNLIAGAVKIIHATAISTGVKTKWGLSISRDGRYWSMGIAVANDTDTGEEPVVGFIYKLAKEKKGE